MKKAFTLIELVFVIVVIGILSAVILPRIQTNPLREVAIQVVSNIRYTQHLAMLDDKYNANDVSWYKGRWQLLFGKSNSGSKNTGGYYAYSIFSDKPSYSGNPDRAEIAMNTLDKSKYLSGGFSNTLDWEDAKSSKKLNIGYSYTVDDVTQSGCGNNDSHKNRRIAFDVLGRPFEGNSKMWTSSVDGILKTKCRLTLHHASEIITIQIEPETGYTCILNDTGTACQ